MISQKCARFSASQHTGENEIYTSELDDLENESEEDTKKAEADAASSPKAYGHMG